MKLFLSTPCYGGLCLEKYMSSIIKLQLLLVKEGIQLYLDTTENESLVHRARNVAVGRFMQKTDCEYFMFIDADVDFDPEAVVRLIRSGHDISVACYPKKVVMWEQAANAVKGGDERNMAMLSSSLVVNFGAQRIAVENGFIPILDGPTGFMCIMREVFKKLEESSLWRHYKSRLKRYNKKLFKFTRVMRSNINESSHLSESNLVYFI